MSKPASKTLIGLFVVIALALVVAAVVVLGSGKFFKNYPKVVMYFQGSVKGLAVGAPVNFRGVKVGAVTDITMLLNPKDLSVIIPVYAELYPESVEALGGTAALGEHVGKGELIPALVERGMRAQLELQSIVTGQLQISLDIYKDKPAVFVRADAKTQEIPTIPTPLQELAKRVEKIPVEEIFEKMDSAMSAIEKIVTSPETGEMLRSVKNAVNETRDLVQDVDKVVEPLGERLITISTRVENLAVTLEKQIGPLSSSLVKTSDEAHATLKKAQETMGTIDDLAGEDSIVSYRLGRTLEELSAAARAMRQLADTLNHQPESIIFGKKTTGGTAK